MPRVHFPLANSIAKVKKYLKDLCQSYLNKDDGNLNRRNPRTKIQEVQNIGTHGGGVQTFSEWDSKTPPSHIAISLFFLMLGGSPTVTQLEKTLYYLFNCLEIRFEEIFSLLFLGQNVSLLTQNISFFPSFFEVGQFACLKVEALYILATDAMNTQLTIQN